MISEDPSVLSVVALSKHLESLVISSNSRMIAGVLSVSSMQGNCFQTTSLT